MIPDEFSAQYGPLIQAAPQFELQAQPQILSASAFRLAHSLTTPRLMPCSSALLPPPPPQKMPHRSFIVTPVPSHCRAQAPLPPSP